MKTLFWGFCFIYLNFSLNLNAHSLNILPDFVGYYLLIKGTEELRKESRFFGSVRPFAVGMMIYTAILWVGALLGAGGSSGWAAQILSVIAMVVALYVSWVLIQGVFEIEETRGADLCGGKLRTRWIGLVVIIVSGKGLAVLADLANLSVVIGLSAILGTVGIVVIILYLIAWSQTVNAYEALEHSAPDGPEL